jgi:hypothetical protein
MFFHVFVIVYISARVDRSIPVPTVFGALGAPDNDRHVAGDTAARLAVATTYSSSEGNPSENSHGKPKR